MEEAGGRHHVPNRITLAGAGKRACCFFGSANGDMREYQIKKMGGGPDGLDGSRCRKSGVRREGCRGNAIRMLLVCGEPLWEDTPFR
jgi:hypothetical protein